MTSLATWPRSVQALPSKRDGRAIVAAGIQGPVEDRQGLDAATARGGDRGPSFAPLVSEEAGGFIQRRGVEMPAERDQRGDRGRRVEVARRLPLSRAGEPEDAPSTLLVVRRRERRSGREVLAGGHVEPTLVDSHGRHGIRGVSAPRRFPASRSVVAINLPAIGEVRLARPDVELALVHGDRESKQRLARPALGPPTRRGPGVDPELELALVRMAGRHARVVAQAEGETLASLRVPETSQVAEIPQIRSISLERQPELEVGLAQRAVQADAGDRARPPARIRPPRYRSAGPPPRRASALRPRARRRLR